MRRNPEARQAVIEKYARQPGDTGSPEVQIALLTNRINELTEHLKIHKKDNHSLRGLLLLVVRRKRLLNYLSHINIERFRSLTDELELRR
jgi:small subunit ribosomal protein S15